MSGQGLPHTRRTIIKAAGAALGATFVPRAFAASASSGKTITIGMEAGSPYLTFFKGVAPRFTEKTGIAVRIQGVPHDNMRQQFLIDALSATGSYDVYETDQPWIPQFAVRQFLVPLDDRIDASDRQDFAGKSLDTTSYRGKIYGLPFMVHNLVLYYRTDLLQAAGITRPPATWDEYRATAKKLTDPSKGIWGTLVEGKQEVEVATRLEAHMQQAGGDILDASGYPSVDSAAAREAFGLMRGLVFEDKSAPPGLLDLTDMQGQFLQGQIAMAPVWPYLYSMAKNPQQSKVVDKFAVAPCPGHPHQVSTIYSWGFGISSASKNRDAAWEWVKWSTSTDILAEFGKNQINPVPRKSALERVRSDDTISAQDREAIATFSRSVEASNTFPMVPQYSQLLDTMSVAISSVMSRNQTPDAALAAAQARMKAIMKK
jgi:multiple sugar transport system substrate-binding protein